MRATVLAGALASLGLVCLAAGHTNPTALPARALPNHAARALRLGRGGEMAGSVMRLRGVLSSSSLLFSSLESSDSKVYAP